MFNFPTFFTAHFPLQITALAILGRGAAALLLNLSSDILCNLRCKNTAQ